LEVYFNIINANQQLNLFANLYDLELKNHRQRYSNNSSPAFTGQKIMTVCSNPCHQQYPVIKKSVKQLWGDVSPVRKQFAIQFL
jgi:hypothetical protein